MEIHKEALETVMNNPHGFGGYGGGGIFIAMAWKWVSGKHKDFMDRITKLETCNTKLSEEIKHLNENKVAKLTQDFTTLQENQKAQENSLHEISKKLDVMQTEGIKRTEKLTEKIDKMEQNIEKSLDFVQTLTDTMKDLLAKVKKK